MLSYFQHFHLMCAVSLMCRKMQTVCLCACCDWNSRMSTQGKPSQEKSGQYTNVNSRQRQWKPSLPISSLHSGTSNPSLPPRHDLAETIEESKGKTFVVKSPETPLGTTCMIQAIQALKEEREQKASLLALLKLREEEIESLHQLLWYSQVAPSQVSNCSNKL